MGKFLKRRGNNKGKSLLQGACHPNEERWNWAKTGLTVYNCVGIRYERLAASLDEFMSHTELLIRNHWEFLIVLLAFRISTHYRTTEGRMEACPQSLVRSHFYYYGKGYCRNFIGRSGGGTDRHHLRWCGLSLSLLPSFLLSFFPSFLP